MKQFALIVPASLTTAASAQAVTIKGAWSHLFRYDHTIKPETFTCDFAQTHAAAFVESKCWAFDVLHRDRGRAHQRQNAEDVVCHLHSRVPVQTDIVSKW